MKDEEDDSSSKASENKSIMNEENMVILIDRVLDPSADSRNFHTSTKIKLTLFNNQGKYFSSKM